MKQLSSTQQLVFRLVVLTIAYYLGGNLGLTLPYLSSQAGLNISLFWPPSGLAIAALMIWGPAYWPGVFMGALAINLATGELSPAISIAIAVSNTVGPLLGAWLLKKHIDFHTNFNRGKDVVVFILIASLTMILTATCGTLSLYVAGKLLPELFPQAWLGWWLGDTVGIVIFTPPLLVWSSYRFNLQSRQQLGKEFIFILIACVLTAWIVFGSKIGLGNMKLSLAFLVFPPLIWAGLRFNILGGSIAAMIVSIIAVWSTANGLGPFSKGNLQIDQLSLCVFVATTAFITYVIIGIQASKKFAEARLIDNESRLRLALTAANQGLYDLNVQTGEAEVTDEYARMLGYDPDSFQESNKQWLERMHPDDREQVYQIYQEYIKGLRNEYRVEFRQLTQKGEWKWILSLGKVVEWDKLGRPVRMLGTHTDISDRKIREIALHRSEEALQRAQSLAKLGSWYFDLVNDAVSWSRETFRIFGLQEDTPLDYENFLNRVIPEDREPVNNAWNAALQGLPFDIEHRIHVEGKIKWIRSRAQFQFDHSGNVSEALGTVQDITERKQAENEISNARALLRTVIDATPDLIYAKDQQYRFLLVNKAYADNLGFEPAQMIGKADTEFQSLHAYHENSNLGIREFHADDDDAFSGKIAHNTSDPMILADGQLHWFDTIKLPMRNTEGEIIGILAYARDITERLRAESKYRTLVEQIPVVTYIVSLKPLPTTVFISPQVEAQFGFTVQEWLNDRSFWVKRLHPDDKDRILEEVSASLKRETPYHLEYRILKHDGNIAWVRDDAIWLKDDTGEPGFIQGVMMNITVQKNAEENLKSVMEELRMSEKHQRELRKLAELEQSRMIALLSGMSIGILFEDRDRLVEYVNPAFLRIWMIEENNNLLGMPTQAVFELSSERFARPPHASKNLLNVFDSYEISERFELELSDGRLLTQVSYPVNDLEGKNLGRLWIYEDITQERQTAQQLLYLAERDPLTGLYNRHRFQEQLESLIAQSLRSHVKFALLYFDLDDFKYINDTFGHRAGDTVLVRTAGEISSIVRHIEIFARLGGDEFAIISQIHTGEDVGALPSRIVTAISTIPLRFRGTNIRLTSSVGVAIFPEHGETAEDLVAHADAAMYQAKNQGKNTWAIYDSKRDDSEAMMTRMTWYNRIAQAIENNHFELHFQGVYRAESHSLSHLEVLVRMRDPANPHNLIMPGQFIPVAEKNGQIVNIDRWVVKQSIDLLSSNPDSPPLAINISGRTFDEPSLPHYIKNLLTSCNVEPQRLIIELTETAAVSDIQDAQRFIEAIHRMGCQVCLDDFGSGFSTFGYLKYLGVEILKIDGLFIHDLPNNRENQIFVKAMVEVARGLGKISVAEFVEDEATFNMIKKLGIDLAQGYYFGRPQEFFSTKPQIKLSN